MGSSRSPYHEDLLHWIWEHRHFELHDLRTGCGKEVTVHHTGRLNKSDGPDFKGAHISIGRLSWHGDVEIHWSPGDWNTHSHRNDPNFQQVILHVVHDDSDDTVQRADGSRIPTLSLSPYINKPLQSFLRQYRSEPQLPCSGQFTFISEEAFLLQLEKAHREYFEQKVDALLDFYDTSLVPSQAWLKMFTVALFDGLGISHNRIPMQKLGRELFTRYPSHGSRESLREKALDISRIRGRASRNSPYGWNHKGVRPGNHPFSRIQQGADCLWFIRSLPFRQWFQSDPERLWEQLVSSVSVTPSLGEQRADILFGTVFLPALYSLGNLFYSKKLRSASWRLWQRHEVDLPSSLLRQLEQTDLSPSLYAHKLGTIHQLRTYCKPRNCQNCKVFKNSISS